MVRNRKSGNNFVAKLQKNPQTPQIYFCSIRNLSEFSGGIKVKRLKKISYIQTARSPDALLDTPGLHGSSLLDRQGNSPVCPLLSMSNILNVAQLILLQPSLQSCWIRCQ